MQEIIFLIMEKKIQDGQVLPEEPKGMELKDLNIKAFNEDLKQLINEAENDDKIRLIEHFLPQIEYDEYKGPAIEFPEEIRPTIDDNERIGRIYFEDVGMHDYHPCCDVYSEMNPEEAVSTGIDLLYSKVVVSEVLTAIQAVTDPERKNEALAKAIDECKRAESRTGDPLYDTLSKYGIATVEFDASTYYPRYCEGLYGASGDVKSIYLTSDGKVMANVVLDIKKDLVTVQIKKDCMTYDSILDGIKRAINIAKRKASNHAER